MLKSANLTLPKTILVNGFLNLNGQKISKSLGNIIRPTDWTRKYGVDATRYYLLRYTTVTEDSNVSESKLIQVYNADLANGLGNLIARITALCEKHNILIKPQVRLSFYPQVEQCISVYRINEALDYIWFQISKIDKRITDERPWQLPSRKAKSFLEETVKHILDIAFNLQPFLPETANIIKQQFTNSKIKKIPLLFPRLR